MYGTWLRLEESVQREAQLVWALSLCCLFLEIGLCFQNFTLASVSTNAAQVERTQNAEVRELPHCWPLQLVDRRPDMCVPMYVGQLMTPVPGLCFAGREHRSLEGVNEGLLTTLQIASYGRLV